MRGKTEVWQGTLALMILKSLQRLGPQHGYGTARRIGQIIARFMSPEASR
jgi:PadR family transcriptional regulator, regulatory protein PadR